MTSHSKETSGGSVEFICKNGNCMKKFPNYWKLRSKVFIIQVTNFLLTLDCAIFKISLFLRIFEYLNLRKGMKNFIRMSSNVAIFVRGGQSPKMRKI